MLRSGQAGQALRLRSGRAGSGLAQVLNPKSITGLKSAKPQHQLDLTIGVIGAGWAGQGGKWLTILKFMGRRSTTVGE